MPFHVLGHAACQGHAPPDHVERPARLEAAFRGVGSVLPKVRMEEAPAAPRDALESVHSPEHVAAVERACEKGGWIDADTWAGAGSWGAAERAAGAAVLASEIAIRGEPALALVRPPGHHATRTRAMGFCLFNNVAIAAQLATRRGKKVAILDMDVHHGNGTQDIFYDRDDVLYVSLHQYPFYPGSGAVSETGIGRGEGFSVNLPLPKGTSASGWLEVLDGGALPVIRAFRPHLILVSLGFDAHARDSLGGLLLTAQTYHATMERIQRVTPRIAAVLEGGYDLGAIEHGTAAVVAGLQGLACPSEETEQEGVRPWRELRPSVARAHGRRWGIGDAATRPG